MPDNTGYAREIRHAGIGWPENAGGEHPSRDYILGMPGMQGANLLCSPSARWHWSAVKVAAPNSVMVWRAIPRQGKLPAQLGWNASKVADECLNLYNEQPHTPDEWLLPLNELQFRLESGQDFPGYGEMAQNLARLRLQLRRKLTQNFDPNIKLMFPAWVPSDEGDHLEDWAGEADLWDGLCLHAYGSAETMRARYDSYRARFIDKLIFVGEWNANHEGHDEDASLAMWAEIAASDPLFLGATYFIWETNNAGEQDLSVCGNRDRLQLFSFPPVRPAGPAPVPIEPPPTPEPLPEPEEPPVTIPQRVVGIDLASYQGYPDWSQVKNAGITFGITKITEDDGYVNPTFAHNWREMANVGIQRGVYHFARPEGNDAYEEAAYFLQTFSNLGFSFQPGDLIALDMEAGAGDLGGWALEWLQAVEQAVGFKPLVYTGTWFSTPHGFPSVPELGQYGLWLASYQAVMPTPPPPWDLIAIWQYSSSGQVPGIVGDVDMNVFNGTPEQLLKYGKPGEIIEPPLVTDHQVGPGILAKMLEAGDAPATDEVFYAHNLFSEAYGQSGSRYVYIASLGQTYRYVPTS